MTRAPTLSVDGFLLRPWRAADAPAIVAVCGDPEIARWAGTPQPFGRDEAAAFLDDAVALWAAGTGAPFAIVDAATGELLGAITRVGPDGHRATLGCWVVARARGRGVGTRAIVAANEPSHRMMARAGFTREGLLRAWDTGPDGEPEDVVSWARLRGDP